MLRRPALCVAGVDVGSTLTKVVVRNGDVLASATDRTRVDYAGAAARLLAEALQGAGRLRFLVAVSGALPLGFAALFFFE